MCKNNICGNMSVIYENFKKIYQFGTDHIVSMVTTNRDYLYNFLKVILEEFKAARRTLMKIDIPSSFPSANDFD